MAAAESSANTASLGAIWRTRDRLGTILRVPHFTAIGLGVGPAWADWFFVELPPSDEPSETGVHRHPLWEDLRGLSAADVVEETLQPVATDELWHCTLHVVHELTGTPRSLGRVPGSAGNVAEAPREFNIDFV